jgi:hypothetical protein
MAVLMRKDSLLSVTLVSAGEINSEDRTYAVTPAWFTVSRLLRSVQELGLTAPLWLERGEKSNLRIVSGFRRFKVAQELEIEKIPCIISSAEAPGETFIGVLWENLGCRSFTEIEKAIALHKLKRQFGIPESQLIKDFLPVLELRADRYHLERYLTIAQLPDMIQQAMVSGGLYTDTALRLSGWDRNEQGFFIELVSRYQLGRNKQKGLFEVLGDLRDIMKAKSYAVWGESGARAIDEDPQLSPQDRLAGINAVLRGLRYPRLTLHEDRYRELRSALRLPYGVRLNVPPYFEGSQVSITIDAESPREIRDLVGEIKHLLDRKELDQIFELM